MDPWSYISPSSGDILNNDNEISDAYFDVDHENFNGRGFSTKVQIEKTPIAVQPVTIKQEIISPNVQVTYSEESYSSSATREMNIKKEEETPKEPAEVNPRLRRRSMSVQNIMQTTQYHREVRVTTLEDDDLSTSVHEEQTSKSNWKNLYEPPSRSMKTLSTCSSQTNLHVTSKFVSMAEAIYHLQRDTPKRFHSYSRKQDNRALDAALNRKKVQLLKSTIPQSPALVSKMRTRPVTALSQKDIEDLEVKEIKKYHIKANPISKGVLLGAPHFPPVQRRPVTQPEPFNLTQIRKKLPPVEKKIVFTARPIPKCILEKPAELPKKCIPVTVPKTPTFMAHRSRSLECVPKMTSEPTKVSSKRYQFVQKALDNFDGMVPEPCVGHSGVPLAQKNVLYPCKPQPFSFEQRDKERQTRKMEKIQQVYAEEKKLREFHANPLPAIILKTCKLTSPKTKVYEKKYDSRKENKENAHEEQHVFKARPPSVLSKLPFVPTRKERPVLEPWQVQLTTEIRARKRDEFNQKIREKEEQHEVMKRLMEEEKLRKEEEEDAAKRTQLVHKAEPVKHYAPVLIHPSEVPLTRPEAPKFNHHKV